MTCTVLLQQSALDGEDRIITNRYTVQTICEIGEGTYYIRYLAELLQIFSPLLMSGAFLRLCENRPRNNKVHVFSLVNEHNQAPLTQVASTQSNKENLQRRQCNTMETIHSKNKCSFWQNEYLPTKLSTQSSGQDLELQH